MHWVDRGPEPNGLAQIRARCTRRWVNHYRHNNPDKPTDSHWRKFRDHLRGPFSSLCAYCEECCQGEVEHFRPKSKFPDLVYQWSNWVFACHDCNHQKAEMSPQGGYVDPCARSRSARPEKYFDFDLISGEIIQRDGLSERRSKKATSTVIDLGLNDYHHLRKRLARIEMIVLISDTLPRVPADDATTLEKFVLDHCSRKEELSSITRVVVRKKLPGLKVLST